MRALLAALLAALVVASAASPHVHAGAQGDHDCPACVARGADEARCETPDVAPVGAPLPVDAAAPVRSRPVGAPLGAVPGQSPPAA